MHQVSERIRSVPRTVVTSLCWGIIVLAAAEVTAAEHSSLAVATPVAANQVTELPACLLGHWVHSHEEDTAETRVYRPAGYPFPPSRGRTGFALGVDGEATIYGIAPADGPLVSPGRWTFLPPDTLRSTSRAAMERVCPSTIVSCGSDKLVVTS